MKKYITINGEKISLQECAEKYNVSLSWIYHLHTKGELEKKIINGTLGSKKHEDLTGQIINDFKIIKRVDSKRNYKTYLVRNIFTGEEREISGSEILTGTFSGECLKRIKNPDDLDRIYSKYFYGQCTLTEFKDLAIQKGYQKGFKVTAKNKTKPLTISNMAFKEPRKIITIKVNNEEKSIAKWAKQLGVSRQFIHILYQKNRAEEYIKENISTPQKEKNKYNYDYAKNRPIYHKRSTQWIDHQGNKFNTLAEMCKFHHISINTFMKKRQENLPLEKCLESKRKCIDHLGNTFKDLKEMCKYWNIPYSLYLSRQKYDWTIEKILTTPINTTHAKGKECIDHKGNAYISVKEMCDTYNITRSHYEYCIRKNIPLKDILEKGNNPDEQTSNHLSFSDNLPKVKSK